MQNQPDLVAINKAVSALHATATSVVAVYLLNYSSWTIPSRQPTTARHSHRDNDRKGHPDDSRNPLISGRNLLANALTTWETVYLLYDTWFMVYATRKRMGLSSNSAALRIVAKRSPAVLAHHVLLASAFLVLQSYIVAGKERGLWVITAFILMNSSSPVMHLRWWLRRRSGKPSTAMDLALLTSFAGARFGVVLWILKRYGSYYHGLNAIQAYKVLRKECKIGTAMLVGFNGVWWTMLAYKVVRRNLKRWT
ncbi:hypothetical protein K458DRAFT_139245 [Lentithecium fluviatile CBS 122367]|uniref:TLC domain-containing protein n=1 Tax=Lentithecium fluviatile CBS 122367 TaxID=1168545 RepID=A0A6G1IKF6_9PLEO|nr:hypothetical protein K458DRAFT_139245 [Lentithecium fluviatile CBS 122367]